MLMKMIHNRKTNLVARTDAWSGAHCGGFKHRGCPQNVTFKFTGLLSW